MLATQVLVCLPIGWVEVLEVLCMLATQVLVCLPIDWFEVLEVLEGECCLDNWVGVGTIIHPEMLASLCAVFPSDKLAAQVLHVCLHMLEVLEGERCLDHCVSDYHPSRDAGFLVCPPVGFVVNTVVTSGGSTIL